MRVAFFDESERDRVLCVAGFLLEAKQAKRLEKEWRKEISEPFRLLTGEPFHMKRLQPLRLKYGTKAIDGYERKALSLLSSRINYATGALFRLDEAEAILTREWRERFGSVYGACCQIAMRMCGMWAEQDNYRGPITYIFEAGHKDQGSADRAISAIGNRPETREYCRYHHHAFLDKDKNPILQAADMWAWLSTRHYVETVQGLPIRESISRLLDSSGGTRYDLRPFDGKENVERLFRETFDQPWRSDKAKRSYDKRIRHLKDRGEI